MRPPRESCLVNISNHPSKAWDTEQKTAALALAERIEDLPFPVVPPEANETAICLLAEECMAKTPPGVTHALVQGEFT